ncbi:MAG: hypothetical protein CV088_05925 [Nitrospira sp. LK70]|nr:hypothetical protein [Nitrospira sp. LK70]
MSHTENRAPTYFDMESISVLPDTSIQLWFRKRDGTWWFWPEMKAGTSLEHPPIGTQRVGGSDTRSQVGTSQFLRDQLGGHSGLGGCGKTIRSSFENLRTNGAVIEYTEVLRSW